MSIPEAPDQDAIERLQQRAEREYPESWIPEKPGEQIAGELVRYDHGTTAYGEQIIAVLRLPDDTERSVWLLHTVLRGEFARLRPHPGELVLVRYEGKKTSANGTGYESYRVEVDREDEPPDWEALGAEPNSEQAAVVQRPLESDDDSDIPF